MQAISTCAYNENMAKRERKILSLKEKVELIKLQKSAGRSQRDLAEQFGIGKTRVQVILKRKAEFLDSYEMQSQVLIKCNTSQKTIESFFK